MNFILSMIGIISIISIFAGFGPCLSVLDSEIEPNMFDLMFGLTSEKGEYLIKWNRNDVLTFLFVLMILIAILGIYILYKINFTKNMKKPVIASSVIGTLSFVSCIMCYFTNVITNADLVASLGRGAIVCGTFYVINVIFSMLAFIIFYIDNKFEKYIKEASNNIDIEENIKNYLPKKDNFENKN